MSTEKKTDGKTAAGMKTGGTGGGGGITSHLRTGMEWNGMEWKLNLQSTCSIG